MFTTTHVGSKNADWALDYLHNSGIVVVEQDLGGNGYRKVAWTVGHERPVVEMISSGFTK
jgi:chemotaxis receptor (MCP) glutamine deamidase CheD